MDEHNDPGFPIIKEASDTRAIRNGVIAGLIVIAMSIGFKQAADAYSTSDDSTPPAGQCPPPPADNDDS